MNENNESIQIKEAHPAEEETKDAKASVNDFFKKISENRN